MSNTLKVLLKIIACKEGATDVGFIVWAQTKWVSSGGGHRNIVGQCGLFLKYCFESF